MHVRENLVASARRHLPCLAFACTRRLRGDTIVLPDLTQIGVKKGLKISFDLHEYRWRRLDRRLMR